MITNLQYLKALSNAHPESGYAKMFGYKEDGDKAIFTKKADFTKFEAEPTIANEFLSDFYNKIVAQHVVNLFEQKPLDMKFGRFLKTYGKVGDIEEYIATKLQAVVDYDSDTAPTNPFEVKKPSVTLSFIKTEDKELTSVTLNYEQWYGAFINAGGLDNLATLILGQLQDSLDMDIYYKICKDLGDTTKLSKTAVITKITAVGDAENARKAYEDIINLVNKMQLPSKTGDYNPASIANGGTPKSRIVIYLNSKYASSFAINVIASLFKSEKIEYSWDIIDFDSTATDVIGVVLDDRAYVYGYRLNFTQSIMNPRNMFVNTYSHRWTKRGIVPFYNAVVLKDA